MNWLKTLAPLHSKKLSIASFLFALVGITLASIIMYDKVQILINPNFQTSCSFNPIISCNPVMSSDQAAAFFNVPNPIWGLIGFGAIAAIHFVSIFVRLPRFIWVANAVGMLLALIFCFWLSTQALFVISALCIYCAGTWVTTSFLFWFGIDRLLAGTKLQEARFYTPLAIIATLLTFAVMVFVAFHTFWLSLL
jgi:uncharacterized membrane protein